ncbi:MAG: thiamine pyrophosphate-dependent dehydrogenase E1 component subunit alpha, partial [Spirochaetes bacterium]|nr:thiamine pyrophosphate-dependent dehydrogenase E1 component subunit alpha [Spirochaetota bacterium]
MYETVQRIRTVEETIAERYSEWNMRCPTHLCTGQEAVAAGVCAVLRRDDFAVSTHRAHGHYIAKGGDINALIAEIYGKATGCSRGKGGSMHLVDLDAGFMGSTAIVGGTIPVGVGLGLSILRNGTDQVSAVFFGDAAVEEGVFYESANFAVLKKLPVLFVCENNLYSVYSPLHVRQPEGREIHRMVEAVGMRTGHGDGNDAPAVFATADEAVRSIRAGGGPVFLEFATYRWREHCGHLYDNDLGYRSEREFLQWKERDPVSAFRRYLLESGIMTDAEIGAAD